MKIINKSVYKLMIKQTNICSIVLNN